MPAGRSGLSWLTFLLSAFTVAQLQQPQDGQRYRSSPPEGSILQPFTIKPTQRSVPRVEVSHHRFRDTDANSFSELRKNSESAAIATLAPAESDPAVRAPLPARSAAGPSGGLSATGRARSLQDWEVEDFVLLATVDGKIHARDRSNGQGKWVFSPIDGRPLVDTEYHRRNNSINNGKIMEDEWLWIVEPTQDGALYVYTAEGNRGIQKLGLTVKQLAEELSPYASDENPAVVYTAEKKSTLYTLNAATGRLIQEFSAQSAMAAMADSCKPMRGFNGLDDDEECESNSHMMIGRTDYTVAIHNQSSLEPICTIRYSEWTPNNRDRDLQAQYLRTMDDTYIYSMHDGRVYNMEENSESHLPDEWRPRSTAKLPAPVVRVFDVARHMDADPKEAALVVLPQPLQRITFPGGQQAKMELENKVFINCTESGGWYALSEQAYPFVTSYAERAQCYTADLDNEVQYWQGGPKRPMPSKSELVGIHSLTDFGDSYERQLLTIAPPEVISEPPKPVQINSENTTQSTETVQTGLATLSVKQLLYLVGVFAIATFYSTKGTVPGLAKLQARLNSSLAAEPPKPIVTQLEPESSPVAGSIGEGTPRKEVRFAGLEDVQVDTSTPITEPSTPAGDGDEALEPGNAEGGDGTTEAPKKKKAHRGQRGGKKRNKKNREGVSADGQDGLTDQLGKQLDADHSMQPDESSANNGLFTDVSNTVHLNNLEIRKDSVLGYGSGGTTVYQGSFEGREVAVKQMLPQYYELLNQEVETLRQSDDHPNVIRYFCTQKDSNFHYIALELCQASLFDLYRDGGNREGLADDQLKLVNQINSNIPAALYQLAAGVAHLHSLRIIHRDIKPQNILIAYPKRHGSGPDPRFVISDFGLCKTLPDNVSTLAGTTGNAGTIGWKAPELILNPKSSDNGQSSQGRNQDSSSSNDGNSLGVKRSVDIFSLGCVFFYVLTNGAHPFDADKNETWTIMRELNIKRNSLNLQPLQVLGEDAEEPMNLISWMLEPNPADRPDAIQVKHHPFFWTPATRLAFLCDVSDHFEHEPRDPPSKHLRELESHGVNVIPRGDFLALLDRKFIDTLGKQRKYQGDRMLDLLRALRNKKNHWADMPEDVQARVGELPAGYLSYWTVRFPQLLIACFATIRACNLEGNHRFRDYMGYNE